MKIALALALVVAGCSPLEVSVNDRRAALNAEERVLADEILGKPLTINLAIAPAAVTFDDDGRAVVDADELEWVFQGEPTAPREVAAEARSAIATEPFDEGGLAIGKLNFDGPGGHLPIYALQDGARWTTLFDVAKPVTATLRLNAFVNREAPVVEFILDGDRVGPMRDLWRPSECPLAIELGTHFLAPGQHVFDIVFLEDVIAGFSIDSFSFERAP